LSEIRLSIIVPTVGRPTLQQTIRSIIDNGFRKNVDELLVISDGPSPEAEKILDFYRRWIDSKFTVGPVTKMVGQAQKNVGLEKAFGSHVVVMDDDDTYSPGAIDSIRQVVSENPTRPHLFKMLACSPRHSYGHCWRSKEILCGNVGTPMLVAPNVPGRVGRFGNHYSGDFDYVKSTVNLYPEKEDALIWVDQVIAYIY